jgi:F-type H+-transporting ATPase subunit alpha
VGGDARTQAMNQVAGQLRMDMANYREVAAFALFASDLDATTQAQLATGQRLQEILKQPQYQPLELEEQVVVIFAGTQGYAANVPVDQISDWERALLRNMESSHPEILKDIAEKKQIIPETEAQLREALEDFNRGWHV